MAIQSPDAVIGKEVLGTTEEKHVVPSDSEGEDTIVKDWSDEEEKAVRLKWVLLNWNVR